MYVPQHFREECIDVLHDAMRQIAFAALVTPGPERIEANHVPMLLEDGVLKGHFARANPVWKTITPDLEALAIFQGPNAYVTPTWYATKVETGKVVPTWNYLTVHAYGHITLFEAPDRLRSLVAALTDSHEANRQTPWSVDDAPPAYIDSQLRAIVGFEFAITRLEGKWKMSQNRSAADRNGVRDALAEADHPIAKHMMP